VPGAVDEQLEPVVAGDERVLVVVRAVDDAVAGSHLVRVTVLPGEAGSAEDEVDLFGGAVRMGRRGQLPGRDADPVDPDGPRPGGIAEPLPLGVHLALGVLPPRHVVPMCEPHGGRL
jgi:hypothetical protein